MQSATDITASHLLPARLPKGFEIGGCIVEGWLRDGGMAAIYRGLHLEDDRRVAIKLQLPPTVLDDQICAHFDLEAEALRRVAGAREIVELLDAGVLDDGRRYFVLEWIDGEDLEEHIDLLRNRDQRLSVPRACRIGAQVARALASVHEHQLVHRDLKPANIMLTSHEDGSDAVKLVDFGIVADLRGGAGTHDGGAAEGEVMGTSAYMPPEQVAGAPPTSAFDIYSLGVVLFEALSGNCVPPDGWTPESLPRVDTFRKGIPAELSVLVHGCISSDPSARPDSAGDLATELEQLALALDGDAGESMVSRPGPARPATASPMPAVAQVPVRTGGTELVPQAEIDAHIQALTTGGTEISLTHQEVLTSTGTRAPLYVPLPPVTERVEPEASGGVPGWLLGLAALLVVGGGIAWALVGVEADEPEVAATVTKTPGPSAEPTPGVVDDAGTDVDEEASTPANTPDAGTSALEPPPPELEPQPEPDPSPPKPPATQGTGGPKPPKQSPTAAECAARREKAASAKRARNWTTVLKATQRKNCWKASMLERKRLRVEAYAELGEFSRCLSEGQSSSDREISARVKYCKKKVG